MKISSPQLQNRVKAGAVLIALLAAFFAWMMASPVGSSPDEDYHLASIWCGQGNREDLCELSENSSGIASVPKTLVYNSACYAFHPEKSADCEVFPSSLLVETDRTNLDGSYPPVFYWVMSHFASSNIEISVLVMRGMNALIAVVMFGAVFFSLPRSLRVPMSWGLAVTAVPLGMFLIPSVNPSSWAIVSAATLWVALVGFLKTETRRQRFALGTLAAVSLVMGAGARSDAAIYAVLAVGVAVILAWKQLRRKPLLFVAPLAIVGVAAAFFLSSGQSSVVSSGGPSSSAEVGIAGLVLTNLAQLPSLWVGSLGTWGLGWLDTIMPASVWFATISIFAAFVFAGWKHPRGRETLAMILVALGLVLIPMYVLVKQKIFVGTDVQPRYLLPMLIIFAGVALISLRSQREQFSKPQLLIAAASLSAANSVALLVNLRRYVSGTEGSFNPFGENQWWWHNIPSPIVVWLLGSVGFTAVLISLSLWSSRLWSTTGSQSQLGEKS